MKKKILYTAYFIIMTVFFLYYLFPGDAVTAYINYQINSQSPALKVSIKKLKPMFPPGIKLMGMDLMHKNQYVLGADLVSLTPSYLSVFKKDKTFFVHADIYEGRLDSRIQAANMASAPELDLDAAFAGIQISHIPALKEFASYRISGIANGNLIYGNREVKSGKGNMMLTITGGAVKFVPALFGIESLTFKTVNAEMDLLDRRVTLKNLELDGREVSGSANGTLLIRKPMPQSTLNIRGEIKPHPSFMKEMGSVLPMELISGRKTKTGGIPFRISGSLDRPNFSLR